MPQTPDFDITPQSRDEDILVSIIEGTEYTEPAESRIEYRLLQLKEVIEGGGDYENLSNKPKINNVTLDGNKSWADLGLSNPMHIAGRVDTVSDLPSTATEGDVYLVGLVADTEKEEYVYVSGGWEYLGTSAIEVDSALSTTSENPVQNKVITSALNDKLKGTNVNNAGITVASDYIELSNGQRLYITSTAPTGTIPEGSIGIGW